MGKDSLLHGEGHWRRVAPAGLALLPDTPAADPALVFLFALFHDSMRFNDSHDPLHGPRGAALAGELPGEASDLEEAEMDLLGVACEEHTNGGVDPNPTVGACWDADRLNLWRVGIRPVPRLLSTEAVRNGGRIKWARGLQREHVDWEDLYLGFGLRCYSANLGEGRFFELRTWRVLRDSIAGSWIERTLGRGAARLRSLGRDNATATCSGCAWISARVDARPVSQYRGPGVTSTHSPRGPASGGGRSPLSPASESERGRSIDPARK